MAFVCKQTAVLMLRINKIGNLTIQWPGTWLKRSDKDMSKVNFQTASVCFSAAFSMLYYWTHPVCYSTNPVRHSTNLVCFL